MATIYLDRAPAARKPRLIGGLLAAVLQVGLGLAIWFGFSPQIVRSGIQTALTSLDLRPPPPSPKPPPPPRQPAHAASGRAAPAHLRAHAAAIVAPQVVPLKPPPVPAAIVAGTAADNAAGAAPVAGPGSGAGGQGAGTGAGDSGSGEGSGGRDVELVGGRIKDSDTPPALRDAPFTGTTRVAVDVSDRGRVTACRLMRSSGNGLLDGITCQLIIARFRFRPALDDQGHPRASQIIYDHDWEISGKFQSDPQGR